MPFSHSHWKSDTDNHITNEMVVWNQIARFVASDGVIGSREFDIAATKANRAGYHLADDYLSLFKAVVDGPHDSADTKSRLLDLKDVFENYLDGPYFQNIATSEDRLLSDCQAGDPEVQARQRDAVISACNAIRDAFERGFRYRVNGGVIDAARSAA